MTNKQMLYPLELLFPAESATLYFLVSKDLTAKSLVATIKCFDTSDAFIKKIEGLPHSNMLDSQFQYLRPTDGITGEWLEILLVAEKPIKRVQVEILPWGNALAADIENLVHGVWAGASEQGQNIENPVNFVSVRGAK